MSKPTLVIIPGWGGSRETWKDFVEMAENDFSVLCIDLPCFGDEPCPDTVWGVEEYADFVRGKVAGLLETGAPVILFGHSFGGAVAVNLAARHRELICGLVLSGAAVFRPSVALKRKFFQFFARIGAKIFEIPPLSPFRVRARRVLYRTAGSPDYIKTEGMQRDIYKKIIRQDMGHVLPGISVPTLVLWGSRDSYVPLRFGKKIAARLQNARLHIIKGGRHGLYVRNPEEVLHELREFAASL